MSVGGCHCCQALHPSLIACSEYNAWSDRFSKAEHIAVIGGGPTGCEIAADIVDVHPGKKARRGVGCRWDIKHG